MTEKRWIPETLFDDLGFRMTFAVEKVLYEQQTEHQDAHLPEHLDQDPQGRQSVPLGPFRQVRAELVPTGDAVSVPFL